MTIAIRNSSSTQKNDFIKEIEALDGENNLDWLRRAHAGAPEPGGLILLGGVSVGHFRVRCAQAQLRRDLMPSLWSLVGILIDDATFVSVPLGLRRDNADVPKNNGIQLCSIADYADQNSFPNIAVINFTDSFESINDNVERIKGQRSVVDLPSLMLPWLGYVWGAGQAANPLLIGQGLPSAVFAETVYGLAGVELTPGLSSSSSCPEAIWVSANWWHDFYGAATQDENQPASGGTDERKGAKATTEDAQEQSFTGARAIVPRGYYTFRQGAAAARDTD